MLEKKVRQSNFELLRVISVILILMSHCDDFFGFGDVYGATLGVNKLINDWLHAGGTVEAAIPFAEAVVPLRLCLR